MNIEIYVAFAAGLVLGGALCFFVGWPFAYIQILGRLEKKLLKEKKDVLPGNLILLPTERILFFVTRRIGLRETIIDLGRKKLSLNQEHASNILSSGMGPADICRFAIIPSGNFK